MKARSSLLVSCLVLSWVAASSSGAQVPELEALSSWSEYVGGFAGWGFEVGDLDGDGRPEFVGTADGYRRTLPYRGLWQSWEWSGTGYEAAHISAPQFNRLSALHIGQADADPEPEVIVGTVDKILVYEARGVHPVHEIDGPSWVPDLATGDVDGDGDLEVVTTEGYGLAVTVFDLSTGAVELSLPGWGADFLELGQADHDAALEIAVYGPYGDSRVLDGATGAVQLGPLNQAVGTMVWSDVDGDGTDEFVYGGVDDFLTAWDLVADQSVWLADVGSPIRHLNRLQLDQDAPFEFAFIDNLRSVHFADSDGSLTVGASSLSVPGGLQTLGFADFDGDGAIEAAAPSYYYNSEGVFVLDATVGDLEWASPDSRGPDAFAVGDADGDGRAEVAISIAGRYSRDDQYVLLQPEIGRATYRGPSSPTGNDWIRDVEIAQLDLDTPHEVCLATEMGRSTLRCFDGASHLEELRFVGAGDEGFSTLNVANVTGSIEPELLAGEVLPGYSGFAVYAVDSQTALLDWRSPPLDNPSPYAPIVEPADLDGDLQSEVVVAFPGSEFLVLDGDTGAVRGGPVSVDLTTLGSADLTGDGVVEILVGTNSGEVVAYDGQTLAVLSADTLSASPIESVVPAYFAGQSYLAVASGEALHLYDQLDQAPVETVPLGSVILDSGSLRSSSIGGADRLWVRTPHSVFELGPPSLLLRTGFETGDISAWSSSVP